MIPWLDHYPDRRMAVLLINGFRDGFLVPSFNGIGFNMVKNLKSAYIHLAVVQEKISKEIIEGRIAGPFSLPPFPDFRLSSLGIIPKKERGSFRMIHHLSYLMDSSLNDEVSDVEVPILPSMKL